MKDTIKDAMLKINQTPENVVKSEKKSQIKNEINLDKLEQKLN